ncbi:MAG: site-specific DNA-methyltransferase [Proteobacteria bacterium]|nr:site-specific DNA-methyltransferase [Pseudomonadota bacterium]
MVMKIIDQFVLGRWEDIIKEVPSDAFNLMYFDPPYGCSYKSNIPGDKKWNKAGVSKSKFDKHILGDDGKGIDWNVLAAECYRVLKPNSFMFIHGDMEHVVMKHAHCFEDCGFTYKGTIAWRKLFSVGGDLKGAMKRSWEPILYFSKGKAALNPIVVKRNGGDVIRKRIEEIGPDWEFKLSDKEKEGFPTQKPLALARQIIQLTTNEGDLICDLFAGSGTSALAARQTNRHFFAIEADKEYYKKFKNRPHRLQQLLLFT